MKVKFDENGKYTENVTIEKSDSLIVGDWIFSGFDNLTSDSNINFQSLEYGNGMFSGCRLNDSALSEIAGTINTVENDGTHIISFGEIQSPDTNSNILQIKEKGWVVKTNEKIHPHDKYSLCTNLNEIEKVDKNYITDIIDGVWDYDLFSLTNGYQMFYDCTALNSFTSNLSSLTDGEYMFRGCYYLKSFNADLPSLTNGDGMF
ncbi:MAG: leucine-rich repeat protein [Paludibacteraceae bacterium]|nr:leucine-rich repeat protein [Paludibacteraceae bacterium]